MFQKQNDKPPLPLSPDLSLTCTKKFRSRLLENLQLSAWYQHFTNDEVVMRMNEFFLKTTFTLQTGHKVKI